MITRATKRLLDKKSRRGSIRHTITSKRFDLVELKQRGGATAYEPIRRGQWVNCTARFAADSSRGSTTATLQTMLANYWSWITRSNLMSTRPASYSAETNHHGSKSLHGGSAYIPRSDRAEKKRRNIIHSQSLKHLGVKIEHLGNDASPP